MLVPTLTGAGRTLEKWTVKRHCPAVRKTKEHGLQAKGKGSWRPHLCLEGLRDNGHFGRLSYKSLCHLHAWTSVLVCKCWSHNHTQFYSNTKLVNSVINSNHKDGIASSPRSHKTRYSLKSSFQLCILICTSPISWQPAFTLQAWPAQAVTLYKLCTRLPLKVTFSKVTTHGLGTTVTSKSL